MASLLLFWRPLVILTLIFSHSSASWANDCKFNKITHLTTTLTQPFFTTTQIHDLESKLDSTITWLSKHPSLGTSHTSGSDLSHHRSQALNLSHKIAIFFSELLNLRKQFLRETRDGLTDIAAILSSKSLEKDTNKGIGNSLKIWKYFQHSDHDLALTRSLETLEEILYSSGRKIRDKFEEGPELAASLSTNVVRYRSLLEGYGAGMVKGKTWWSHLLSGDFWEGQKVVELLQEPTLDFLGAENEVFKNLGSAAKIVERAVDGEKGKRSWVLMGGTKEDKKKVVKELLEGLYSQI